VDSGSKAAALQMAIWWLEEELHAQKYNNAWAASNSYIDYLLDTENDLTEWRDVDYDSHGSEAPGVWVLNLYDINNDGSNGAARQDTLVMGSHAAPEPATMGIWALGVAGFAGAGAYRRRKLRKA
jgi:MYXO-CTERM domain-containing protein